MSASRVASPSSTGVVPRDGLGDLRSRLYSKPCRVAYLGASVTAQKEGYRPLLHRWFADFFGQPHQEINAGFGGVGSVSGVFMMDQQVISQKPDLCLIEYATGDMGCETPLSEIAAAVEGMVLKLREAGCHACFVYLYRRDEDFDDSNPVIAEYERVADHYGVPSLNAGKLIQERIFAGNLSAEDILRDKVHTTAEGSRITAELISSGLLTVFEAAGDGADRATKIPPPPLASPGYRHTKIIPAARGMLREPENAETGRFRFAHDYVRVDDTNEIRFIPEGDLVGLLVIVGKDAGIIDVSTPESREEYTVWDEWCTYNRLTTVIFRKPIPNGTPARIKVTDKPVLADLHLATPVKKSLNVIGFLVREGSSDR